VVEEVFVGSECGLKFWGWVFGVGVLMVCRGFGSGFRFWVDRRFGIWNGMGREGVWRGRKLGMWVWEGLIVMCVGFRSFFSSIWDFHSCIRESYCWRSLSRGSGWSLASCHRWYGSFEREFWSGSMLDSVLMRRELLL
jgi:hypothetical protein